MGVSLNKQPLCQYSSARKVEPQCELMHTLYRCNIFGGLCSRRCRTRTATFSRDSSSSAMPPPFMAPPGQVILACIQLMRTSARCWFSYLVAPRLNDDVRQCREHGIHAGLVSPTLDSHINSDTLHTVRGNKHCIKAPHLAIVFNACQPIMAYMTYGSKSCKP